MAQPHPKTIQLATPKASLTPCILDQDPEQLRRLSEVIEGMGYEVIATADPEEALGLVRSGRWPTSMRRGKTVTSFSIGRCEAIRESTSSS